MSAVDRINDMLTAVALGAKVDVTEEEAASFGAAVSIAVERALSGRGGPKARDENVIYFSELGSPCQRRTWYRFHGHAGETLTPPALIKFLYGDILEELMLFLAEKAGCVVEGQQGQVIVDLDNGWVLRGRIDAIIDGVVTDVKSASTFAMRKFESLEALRKDDPFGYEDQLVGYGAGLNRSGEIVKFLAVDKTLGNMAELAIPVTEEAVANLKNKARNLSVILEGSSPPPKMAGFEVPDGKSGNMAVCTTCSYCPYKTTCHADTNGGKGLRLFMYAGKPKWLTKVVRQPAVPEIK